MGRHGSRSALVFLRDPYEALELRDEAPLRENAHFGGCLENSHFGDFPAEKFTCHGVGITFDAMRHMLAFLSSGNT